MLEWHQDEKNEVKSRRDEDISNVEEHGEESTSQDKEDDEIEDNVKNRNEKCAW